MTKTKKLALSIAAAILGISCAGGAFAYYISWSQEQEMLNHPPFEGWTWHDDEKKFQFIGFLDTFVANMLRVVDLEEKKMVVAYINHEDNLAVEVDFEASCTPGTTVQTKARWYDGTPISMNCIEAKKKTYLTVATVFEGSSHNGYDITWKKNLGGFEINEDFGTWPINDLLKLKTEGRATTY